MEAKKFYTSKTFWFNVLAFVAIVAGRLGMQVNYRMNGQLMCPLRLL